MTALITLILLFVIQILLTASFLYLGARWLKANKPTFFRAVALTIAICLSSTFQLVPKVQESSNLLALLILQAGTFVVLVAIWCALICWVFGTTWVRGLAIWLFALVPGLLCILFVFIVIRPFVLAAYVIPTNSMAPTLVGWHKTAACAHCSGTMIVPASPPDAAHFIPPEWLIGICGDCFKPGQPQTVSPEFLFPDRIICNQLLTPQRWELIVFRFPRDPSKKYIARLIGMPGEKVFIKNGAVWVNGTLQSLPDSIKNLKYSEEFQGGMPIGMGTEDRPWHLSESEACVLGDFSLNSSDSRDWGPVPVANIEGVVSMRYWPLSRWELWR